MTALGIIWGSCAARGITTRVLGNLVTVQVVETEITPLLAPSEHWRGVETWPLHHVEPLHTLW